MGDLALLGSILDEQGKVDSYIISVGEIILRVKYDTMYKILEDTNIEGVKISKGDISTDGVLYMISMSLDEAEKIKYASYDTARIVIENVQANAVDRDGSTEIVVKDIEVKDCIQLLHRVIIDENEEVYMCRLVYANKFILINKESLIRFIRAKAVQNAKIRKNGTVKADIPEIYYEYLQLADKTIYNVVGDIIENNERYVISGLTYDFFGRIANIEVLDKIESKKERYDTFDYIQLMKLKHKSQLELSDIELDRERLKYPYKVCDKNRTKLVDLSYERAKKILKDNVIKDDHLIRRYSEHNDETLFQCRDIKSLVRTYINRLKSNQEIVLEIKDTDRVEAVGLGMLSTKGYLSKPRNFANSLVIIKVNDWYNIVPYSLLTRSVVQQLNNIDLDELKRYDIAESMFIKGHKQYDQETGVSKFTFYAAKQNHI